MSQKRDQHCATVFKSSLGWFAVAWRGQAVSQLTFGHRTRKKAIEGLKDVPSPVPPAACPDSSLVARLQEYANGAADDFSDILIDTEHLTRFGRRVVNACRGIPYGNTASYGVLAKKAGSPKAARAVGQCMASNRVPLIVPCHRVVTASGKLGGFSAPGGVCVKQRLLNLEGS